MEDELRASFPSLSSLPPSTPLTPLLHTLSILPRCGLTLTRPPPTSFTFTRLLSLIKQHSDPTHLTATYTPTPPTCTLSFHGLTASATHPRRAQAQDGAASVMLVLMGGEVGYRGWLMVGVPGVGGGNRKSAVVNLMRGQSVGKGVGVGYEYQRIVREGEGGDGCVVRYGGWGLGWGWGRRGGRRVRWRVARC